MDRMNSLELPSYGVGLSMHAPHPASTPKQCAWGAPVIRVGKSPVDAGAFSLLSNLLGNKCSATWEREGGKEA